MPRLHTHLHLSKIFLEQYPMKNPDSFLLGNIYPDQFEDSEKMMHDHYKNNIEDDCNLSQFLNEKNLDDFNMGFYFHLWVDNKIKTINLYDITKQDCLICDMDAIFPIIEDLKSKSFTGIEKEAFEHLHQLDHIPMLLYIVSKDKQEKYEKILHQLVSDFIVHAQNELIS